MPRSSLVLLDARDPRVERTWRTLEARAQPAYFLSWAWIEGWLEALPADRVPPLAVVRDDGVAIAAFFLGARAARRHLVLASRALYFNATGSPRHDELGIEHNGLLAAPGACRSLASLVGLLPGDWDELYLPAIDRYAFDDLGATASAIRVRIEREAPAPLVDLDAVRAIEGGYGALLGASTRTHLDRARGIVGDLDVEIAGDEAHAIDIYGELLRLHARASERLGRRGAFADPWFERFHRRLIRRRLAHGEIQLVRVRAAGATLGCLYSFVCRGRVLSYQWGLASFDDASIDAGYLCHAAAIEHNARAGHAVYELLAGPPHYNQQLATGAQRIVWVRVQRPRVRWALEQRVRRWKHAIARARPPRLALSPA
ncbi:MAG TPA: GNAT family N-acetyltransferase [Kofleriaceae bacterium]|nr:GNAT family N-acetyltransferase [Kofleriaceae bacterium]